MCCFSGPVEDVSATKIFARMVAPGRQLLAYQMDLAAAEPVAMILPIPTARGVDEVKFIALDGYPDLFDDLHRATTVAMLGFDRNSALPVHVVGDFVASFVPSLAHFGLLDPRFRLPPNTVERVPGYGDFGFVVFQLHAMRSRAHPMAFEFSTRAPDQLFFPLLHVHDGELHPDAHFDHSLYAQGVAPARPWSFEELPLKHSMRHPLARLVVDLDAGVLSRRIAGTWPNHDLWVAHHPAPDDLDNFYNPPPENREFDDESPTF